MHYIWKTRSARVAILKNQTPAGYLVNCNFQKRNKVNFSQYNNFVTVASMQKVKGQCTRKSNRKLKFIMIGFPSISYKPLNYDIRIML